MTSIAVMGVSGCGKTSFGEALARELRLPFVEGDSLHPPASIAKMSAGIPLNDEDRWPWLELIGQALAAPGGQIVSCSALKRIYRDRLRNTGGGGIRFVCLSLTKAVLSERLRARRGHFMPATLLDSQLATLELPAGELDALILDADRPVSRSVDAALQWLASQKMEQQR